MEFEKFLEEPWNVPVASPPEPPPQPKPQWMVVTVKDHQGTIYGAFTVCVPPGQPLPAFHTVVQPLY